MLDETEIWDKSSVQHIVQYKKKDAAAFDSKMVSTDKFVDTRFGFRSSVCCPEFRMLASKIWPNIQIRPGSPAI